ncbi:zona pellucida sperm-binding protein 3-like [Aplochiton taeniatus]
MFGIGQPIQLADLTLGTCAATGHDAQTLFFQSELQGCGSHLTMTNDALIYTYTLNYTPRPLGASPIVRTSSAAVIVECHYPRNHNVSSHAINPIWIPFSAVKVSEELLYFSLKLMMEDFNNERPSYQYYLGDTINFEATVKQYFHVPLRIFVDSCVGSAHPDPNSSPSYVFIQNHGCLVDGVLTGSASKFLPRVADNKLQFQIEAFRFQSQESGTIYVTCHLKATSAVSHIDTENRACSYINGWKEASGSDVVCGSCDIGGVGGGAGGVGGGAGASTWEATISLQMNIREKQPVA